MLLRFIVISVLNANNVDPEQTPRSVASDLSLHSLQMSILWDARHKWIKHYLRSYNLISSLFASTFGNRKEYESFVWFL